MKTHRHCVQGASNHNRRERLLQEDALTHGFSLRTRPPQGRVAQIRRDGANTVRAFKRSGHVRTNVRTSKYIKINTRPHKTCCMFIPFEYMRRENLATCHLHCLQEARTIIITQLLRPPIRAVEGGHVPKGGLSRLGIYTPPGQHSKQHTEEVWLLSPVDSEELVVLVAPVVTVEVQADVVRFLACLSLCCALLVDGLFHFRGEVPHDDLEASHARAEGRFYVHEG